MSQTTANQPSSLLEFKEKGNSLFAQSQTAPAEERRDVVLQAIAVYNEGLALPGFDGDPSRHLIFGNLAECHLKLRDAEQALPFAIKAAELKPDFWKHHWRAARAALGVRNCDKSLVLAHVNSTLKVDPKFQEALTLKKNLSLSTVVLPEIQHRRQDLAVALNFIILMEMVQYRKKKRIADNKDNRNNKKINKRLQEFPYFALIRVAWYLAKISSNLKRSMYFYEKPRVVPHMACSVAVELIQVDLSHPLMTSLALPMLKNDNRLAINQVVRLTQLPDLDTVEILIASSVSCLVDRGVFWFGDIQLAQIVVAAQVLASRDKRLPLLQGLRPVQARDVCRLLIPHTKPDRGGAFDDDYNQFGHEIILRVLRDNQDYDAPGLLEVLRDRVQYFEDLIRNARRPSDSLRQRVAAELNSLSTIHHRLGCLEEALKTQQRQLEILRALNDQGNVAVTLNNLGMTLTKMKDYQEARDTLQEAIVLIERIHGVDSKDVAQSLHNLSSVQMNLGRQEEARATAERALRIMETHFYEEDPALYARVLGQNAQVLRAIGGDANLNCATNQVNQAIALEIRQFGRASKMMMGVLAAIEEKQRRK